MTTPVDVTADLVDLYNAIMAKTKGQQISQAGHKDKQTSFANVSLSEMIRLYRQLWTKSSGLPLLSDVGTPVAKRGPVMRFHH